MHAQALAFVASVAPQRPPGLVLEIGGRNINGSVRALFPGDGYLSVDLRPGPEVDVVADGASFVPDVPPACIVCCEVLEHTPAAPAICAHAHAILHPRGCLILTAAGAGRAPHSAIDGGPLRPGEFYRNVWPDDLRQWLRDFAAISIRQDAEAGDIYALAIKGGA